MITLRKTLIGATLSTFAVGACSSSGTPDSADTAAPAETAGSAVAAEEHFDPKGKPPSEHTLAVRAANAANLPFADERDR